MTDDADDNTDTADTDDTTDTGDTSGQDGTDTNDDNSTIERGLRAYIASDVAADLYDSVDVDALTAGATFDEAVEYEAFGEALGRLAGHAAARGASSNGALRQMVKGEVASDVGGKAGRAAGAAFVEHADTDAFGEYLRSATSVEGVERLVEQARARTADAPDAEADVGASGSTTGPTDDTEWTEIEIEDGDAE